MPTLRVERREFSGVLSVLRVGNAGTFASIFVADLRWGRCAEISFSFSVFSTERFGADDRLVAATAVRFTFLLTLTGLARTGLIKK